MVDALFQILLSDKPSVPGIEIDDTYELDGVSYEKSPRKMILNGFELEFDQRTDGILDRLPSNFSGTNWIWLKVTDELLDRYDMSVKSNASESAGFAEEFENFLRRLLSNVDRWVIVFLLHYDQIDSIYQSDVNSLIVRLRNILSPDGTSEGFIAYFH